MSAVFTRITNERMNQREVKALTGSERKREELIDEIHMDSRWELDTLRKSGVKFDLRTLRALELHMVG